MEALDLRSSVSCSDINKLTISCLTTDPGYRYAWYIYRNDQIIEKFDYTDSNVFYFWMTDEGTYKAEIYILLEDGRKISFFTDTVEFEGLQYIYFIGEQKKQSFPVLRNTGKVLREIHDNRARMFRLSVFDYAVAHKDLKLGFLWTILNPLIQILTYWFAFGIVRNASNVDGIPFLPWLLCGMIPWFYLSSGITRGASSINSKAATLLRMNYPIATVPVESTIVCIFDHCILLALALIVFVLFGFLPKWRWINLIYYSVYETFFVVGVSLITSACTMVVRDVTQIVNAVVRLWFYFTPVFWQGNLLPEWAQFIVKFNPAAYIVNGFRESIFADISVRAHWRAALFFWGIGVVLFVVGCNLQEKYRMHYIDMQ